MAIDWHPRSAELNAPPRQKLPGGRPCRLLPAGVERAGHQRRGEAAIGGADLVRARGKPLAHKRYDPGRHSRQGRGKLQGIHVPESAAGFRGLIAPGDTEQVGGVHVPQPDAAQLFLDLLRRPIRLSHLGKGGQGDMPLSALADIAGAGFLVYREADHAPMKRRGSCDVKEKRSDAVPR